MSEVCSECDYEVVYCKDCDCFHHIDSFKQEHDDRKFNC